MEGATTQNGVRVKSVTLRAALAYADDVGTGIVRTAPAIINALGLVPGNIIEIKGRRRTSARVSSHPWDVFRGGQINLDAETMENARVAEADNVTISKANLRVAAKVIIRERGIANGHSWHPPFWREAFSFIAGSLEFRGITVGDKMTVPTSRKPIALEILEIRPELRKNEVAVVDLSTHFTTRLHEKDML